MYENLNEIYLVLDFVYRMFRKMDTHFENFINNKNLKSWFEFELN